MPALIISSGMESDISDLIKPGIRINQAELLFTKVEDSEIELQLEKLRKNKN